jgi:hypothetical protein
MPFYNTHEGYYARAAEDASRIPTVLMGGNSLLREGIKHILSETCFQIQEDAVRQASSLSRDADAEVVLVVLGTARDRGRNRHEDHSCYFGLRVCHISTC